MRDNDAGWATVEICGKAADIFTPPRGTSCERAVLFLHGASGHTIRDDPVFTAELSRCGLPTVCPHGGRSWWLDRVSREFDATASPIAFVREQIVPWIHERWGVAPPAIGLLGISMGGQGALQLAYRHPREFPVVAAISPAVDFHILWGQGTPLDELFDRPEAARQQTATLHLHPLNWPRHQLIVCDPADRAWYEGAERLASKLSSMGIPFESDLETSAGGHSWEYFRSTAGRCVSFLSERLAADGPAGR
ncbi:MAG: alpha/beta hydrolase-fold protein [Planctomycetaceae bacterium]